MAPEHFERGTAEVSLAARQGVVLECPSYMPIDCTEGLCCSADSVCKPPQGDTGLPVCVVTSLGITITLPALPGLPKVTTSPKSTSSAFITVLPTTTSDVSATSLTISGSILSGLSTITTSPSDSTPPTPSTSTDTGEGSSEAAPNLGANLNGNQKAALVATPLGSIVLGLLVYMLWWRRRKATTERSVETMPLQDRRPGDESPPPGGSRRSSGPDSLAPTPTMEIFSRAAAEPERDHWPLQSHPITVPESAFQSDSNRRPMTTSLNVQQSASSLVPGGSGGGGGGAGYALSEAALATPAYNHIPMSMRRSSNAMRITTTSRRHDSYEQAEPYEAGWGAPKPAPSPGPWNFTRWSRRQGSEIYFVPRSPTRPGSDWITPIDWGDDGFRKQRQSWYWETATADEPYMHRADDEKRRAS